MSAQVIRALRARADQLDAERADLSVDPRQRPERTEAALKLLAAEFRALADMTEAMTLREAMNRGPL